MFFYLIQLNIFYGFDSNSSTIQFTNTIMDEYMIQVCAQHGIDLDSKKDRRLLFAQYSLKIFIALPQHTAQNARKGVSKSHN